MIVRLLQILIVVLLLSVIGSTFVVAQDQDQPTSLSNVHLWIYPEYDDPRLLVMLEGRIEDIEVPATIRFLVPSGAEMYSAGSMDDLGNYSGGPPKREPSTLSGWDEISYQLTTDTFRVEYYDPIILGSPDKTISYEFRWLYPISSLHVIVQEPKQSNNFEIIPQGILYTDIHGFTGHRYEYFDLDDEQSIVFGISYTKSNTLPSLYIEDDKSDNTILIITTVVGICLVLVVGLFWVIKTKPRNRAGRRRTVLSKANQRYILGERPTRKFCAQCGQSMEKSSRFCQYCGFKLS
ncbi:MAG: zinc ribbon domain-containing protein [Dehalococcoidia bacterium]|nr:MAG: zinc ribbon domain-containing protein [Dehalococcoidia bacterium]